MSVEKSNPVEGIGIRTITKKCNSNKRVTHLCNVTSWYNLCNIYITMTYPHYM